MSTIIYVDVDDTLIRTAGTKSDGAQLYLWSAGGADYCEEVADELGIRDCFSAFLPKPRIMIDDQEVRDWVFCTTFHPSTCAGRRLEDYFRL